MQSRTKALLNFAIRNRTTLRDAGNKISKAEKNKIISQLRETREHETRNSKPQNKGTRFNPVPVMKGKDL